MDFTPVGNSVNLIVAPWFCANYDYASWSTTPTVKAQPYVRAPILTSLVSIPSALADLNTTPGWVPGDATVTPTDTNIRLAREVDGTLRFFRLMKNDGTTAATLENSDGWELTTTSVSVGDQEVVSAVAYYLPGTYTWNGGTVVDPVLFVSTSGIGINTVVHDGALVGTFDTRVPNGAYLVAIESNPSHPLEAAFYAGSIQVRPSTPRWESAHAEHVWLTPQRINFMANPRFATDTSFWRAGTTGVGTATLTRVVAGDGHAGEIAGTGLDSTSRLVLESNFFPISSFWASVSLLVKGSGKVHAGLVSWAADYRSGPTFTEALEQTIGGGGYEEIHFLMEIPSNSWECQLRIEFEGAGPFDVTNVLVDPHEGQYEYFDGDDTSGLPHDYRWMGGLRHQHFSLWYNNEENANARLFGLFDTSGDNIYKYGLLESWAPTGATFIPHWNSIGFQQPLNWVGDYFYPLVDIQGTPVTGELTYADEDGDAYTDEDGVPYSET